MFFRRSSFIWGRFFKEGLLPILIVVKGQVSSRKKVRNYIRRIFE